MEQRTLRLGDIVDDYCPREKRLTNHAIVAVVDDTIKQTRCTTCDAEHVYKNGREPRIRKKAGESLYDQVLGDLTGGQLKTKPAEGVAGEGSQQAPGLKPQGSMASPQGSMASPQGSIASPQGSMASQVSSASPQVSVAARTGAADEPAVPPEQTGAEKSDADAKADAWLAHRRLIRAALPKIEGELPPPRPIPEFTMHQRPQGRGGRPFRFGGGGGGFTNGGGERNGNVAHGPRDHRHGGHHQNGGGSNANANRGSWQGGGEGQGQGRPPGGGRRRGRRKRSGGGGRGPVS